MNGSFGAKYLENQSHMPIIAKLKNKLKYYISKILDFQRFKNWVSQVKLAMELF